MLPGATASSIPTPPAGSDTESLNELAPEARKNLAPAVRPGTKPADAQGPEGRKINATNLTPLRGSHYDVYDSPGLPPGLGSNGPPGLSVEDPPSEDPSAAHLIGQVPKPQLPESPATTTKAIPSDSSALAALRGVSFPVLSAPSVAAVADKNPAKVVEQPVAPLPVSRETHPELERAFADVTKFELTVQPEVSAASLARGEQRTAIPQDSPSKLAIVTTDAVANVLQQQLPPRVVPVLRVVPEQKPADRSKPNPGSTLISRRHRRHATSTISFAPQSGSISRLQHIRSKFQIFLVCRLCARSPCKWEKQAPKSRSGFNSEVAARSLFS